MSVRLHICLYVCVCGTLYVTKLYRSLHSFIMQLAKDNGIKFFETSAYTAENISEVSKLTY